MKLAKAIEISTLISRNLKGSLGYDGVEAIKLLIEAGKRIQEGRRMTSVYAGLLLPGETEE